MLGSQLERPVTCAYHHCTSIVLIARKVLHTARRQLSVLRSLEAATQVLASIRRTQAPALTKVQIDDQRNLPQKRWTSKRDANGTLGIQWFSDTCIYWLCTVSAWSKWRITGGGSWEFDIFIQVQHTTFTPTTTHVQRLHYVWWCSDCIEFSLTTSNGRIHNLCDVHNP